MKKAIFLYNPISGDRSIPDRLDYIIGRFMENGILIQPFRLMENTEDALINILKEGDFEYAVVSGGDGTINVVVNSMLKNGINMPIGVIPSGTCNDFARSLNIPHDLKRSLDIILEGKTIDVDLGLINDSRYFIGTCAGGLFVNASISTSSELKKSFGPLAYYLKALSEVTNLKSFKIKIQTDTECIEEDALVFLVMNGKNAAGFTNIVEEADISDGFMDIILIKDCLHIDLAAMFFKVLANDLVNDRHVVKLKSSSCLIDCSDNVSLTVDGEKAEGMPLSIKFINKALKVFVK